jgi:hypothetical protein
MLSTTCYEQNFCKISSCIEGELTGVKLARGRVHASHMILEKEVLTSKRTEREVGQQRPEGEAK